MASVASGEWREGMEDIVGSRSRSVLATRQSPPRKPDSPLFFQVDIGRPLIGGTWARTIASRVVAEARSRLTRKRWDRMSDAPTRLMTSTPCPPTRSRSRPGPSSGRSGRSGPGLILAASIVGTGELINTTEPGGQGRVQPALADPAELRDQGLRPGRARPVRDHPRQDDAGGVRHPARARGSGPRGSAGSGCS